MLAVLDLDPVLRPAPAIGNWEPRLNEVPSLRVILDLVKSAWEHKPLE
jgi:hypothetical protein